MIYYNNFEFIFDDFLLEHKTTRGIRPILNARRYSLYFSSPPRTQVKVLNVRRYSTKKENTKTNSSSPFRHDLRFRSRSRPEFNGKKSTSSDKNMQKKKDPVEYYIEIYYTNKTFYAIVQHRCW